MNNVIIVDDEMIVRLGLKTMINWDEAGFEIIGEARNADEAIELVKSKNVELVITDISMPETDGLKLIKSIKEINPSIKFIILSHYDNFDFARKAIDLKVENYILKSELDENVLINALKKIKAKESQFIENIKIKNEITELLKNAMLNNLTENDFTKMAEIKNFSLLYGNILSSSNNIDFDKRNKVLKEMFDNHFIKEDLNSHLYINKNDIIILTQYDTSSFSSEQSNKCYNNFAENIRKIMNTIIISNSFEIVNSKENLFEVFQNLKSKLILNYFDQNEEKNENFTSFQFDIFYLKNLLSKNQINDTSRYLHNTFNLLYNKKNILSSWQTINKIINLILEFAKEVFDEEIFKELFIKYSYFEITKNISFSTHKQIVFNLFEDVVAKMNSGHFYTLITIKSIKIIEENFDSELSLSVIAESLDINKSYLSSTFKNDTGTNLTSYITNFRIDKAKELLLQTDLKIYQIAERVGLSNVYYFSKIFKDVTGLTCKEYRKMYFNNLFEEGN